MNEKSKRLPGLDFIRTLCCVGIIVYHFAAYTNCPVRILADNANTDWGEAFVALFFLLSGFSLYYNHSSDVDPGKFYLRRFGSIFPSFWLGYIIVFFIRVIENGKFFFFDGYVSRWTLVLSAVGMDGYLLYRIPDYYLIGEWFLGAIILLYLLYPLVLKLFNRIGAVLPLILAVLFVLLTCFNPFQMTAFRNPVSCLLFFTTGMLICRYRDRLPGSLPGLLVSVAVAAVIALVKLPLNEDICKGLLGISLFLPLYRLGELVCRPDPVRRIFKEGSSISYEAFLLHHVILIAILKTVNPVSVKKMLVVLAGTVIIVLIAAGLLKTLKNEIVSFRLSRFTEDGFRISELDIAKGLGIIAVMLVHLPREFRLIPDGITFHLAVFFAVSGILSEKKKYDIRKDLANIMLPYLILSVLFICYVSIKYYCSGHPEMIAGDAKVYAFYTLSLVGCGTLWFLPALFLSKLICELIRRVSGERSAYFQASLLILGSLLAWLMQMRGLTGAPQALSVSAFVHNLIIALVQAVIGAGMAGTGRLLMRVIDRYDSIPKTVILTIVFFAANLAVFRLYDGNDMHYAGITDPAGFILGTAFGCAGILSLSKLIKRVPYLGTLLIFFGVNSLIIMTTHLEYDLLGASAAFSGIVTQNSILRHLIPIIILCVIEWMLCLVINATPLMRIYRPLRKKTV